MPAPGELHTFQPGAADTEAAEGRLCKLRVKTTQPASQPETGHIGRLGHFSQGTCQARSPVCVAALGVGVRVWGDLRPYPREGRGASQAVPVVSSARCRPPACEPVRWLHGVAGL